MEPFTITLEAARVNAGLTQEKLAKLLGVHRTTLHNWETGKTSPDLTHLRRVSHITGIPMDYLFLPGILPKVEGEPEERGRAPGARRPAKALGVALALALGALGALSPEGLWAKAESGGGAGGGSDSGPLCTRYVCTERDPLNVREGPSRHSPWVYRLDRGEAVTVHEVKNGWAYVERCGDYGWAWAAYLGESPPADKPAGERLAADQLAPDKPAAQGLPEAWLAVEEDQPWPPAIGK